MSKTGRVILQIVIVVLLAVLLIGGALYYTYASTDAAAVPQPQVLCGAQALVPDSVSWNTAVFAGLAYKPYEMKDPAQRAALSERETPSLIFQLPVQEYTCTVAVSGAGGVLAVPAPDETGALVIPVTQNGDYTYDITLSRLQQRGQSFGLLHYSGTVHVAVEPHVEFSSELVAQGGVVSVVVSGVMDDSVPEVTCTLTTPHLARAGDKFVAYLGVHYNTAPGEYDVLVRCGALAERRTITVVPAEFARQDITVDSATEAVSGSAAALAAYRSAIYPLYEIGDDTLYWRGAFTAPLAETVLNTEYGLYRYTNGSQTAERHAGVDLDGDEGDAVMAAAAGRVVFAGYLEVTGNTVVIEHGAGLKTFYCHMSSLACSTGSMVEKGAVIGTVGSTGYSTGPHLHFEARVGNQAINPMELLKGTSGVYFTE